MSKIWVVARFELWTNLRRWEFLFMVFGLPILTGMVLALSSIPNAIHALNQLNNPQPVTVGVIDETGQLHIPVHLPFDNLPALPLPVSLPASSAGGFDFSTFPHLAEGRAALLADHIEYLYLIPPNYIETGDVQEYSVSRGFFRHLHRTPPMRRILEENLLQGRLAGALLRRAEDPMRAQSIMLTPTGQTIQDPMQQELGGLLLPTGMMLLMLMSVVGSSTYLLRSLSEEKENRIMEILLSSVSPATLFYGKILGLGLLGLIQVLVWLLMTLPFYGVLMMWLHISVLTGVLFIVYFALGYTLFAGMIAGVGAIGSSEKESNQIVSIFMVLAITPVMLMPIILDDPNGTLSRAFSFIPFTAPMVVMLRLTGDTPVPTLDIVLSLLVMLAASAIVFRLSLKIFRMGLLMYGKAPHPREVLRWLRES